MGVWVCVCVPLIFAQSPTKINTPTSAPPLVVKKASCIMLNVLYHMYFERNVCQRVHVEKDKKDFNKTLYDCSSVGGLEIASG